MAPLETPFKPMIFAVALAFSAGVQATPLTTTVTGGNILLSGANLGERTGLDLDFITSSGDTSILTTNLTQFFGLEA